VSSPFCQDEKRSAKFVVQLCATYVHAYTGFDHRIISSPKFAGIVDRATSVGG
jgi:hypothetical protein